MGATLLESKLFIYLFLHGAIIWIETAEKLGERSNLNNLTHLAGPYIFSNIISNNVLTKKY